MLQRPRPERHVMQLNDTHDSGAEEWYCPICGRRFLMQWPPNYKRIILEHGDEGAVHTGGKGGVDLSSSSFGPEGDAPDEASDGEPGLSQELMDALDELDFSPLDDDEEA